MGVVDLPRDHRERVEQQATVADKIRALNRLGYARADIGRILDKRYQHVRNVLERDRAKRERSGAPAGRGSSSFRLSVGPDGSMALPEALVDALRLGTDRTVIARACKGEVQLMTPATALARAQALLSPYIRGDALLSDEILADRRAEVERERQG